MAKMGVAEMMAVLQVYATGGRDIQYRDVDSTSEGAWTTTAQPTFNFHAFEYRPKPAPKEFLILVDKRGEVVGGTTNRFQPGQVVSHYSAGHVKDVTVVKVREVL